MSNFHLFVFCLIDTVIKVFSRSLYTSKGFNNMYKRFTFSTALLLCALFQSANAESHIDNLDDLFDSVISEDSVPGVSVAIGENGHVSWAKGYGYADLESHVPMTRRTKLRIASISKVVTAAALMRLKDRGVIELDSYVGPLVEAWPGSHADISFRQITNHTSGIRYYSSMEEILSNVEYSSTIDALDIFKDDDLLFYPGTDFQYSTYAWTLLAAAMESASGVEFKELVQEEVFDSLNLKNSTFDENSPIISHRQRAYSYWGESLSNSPEVNSSYKYAGGGMLSTPSDLVRFALSHLDSRYLSDESISELFTPGTLTSGDELDFGVGWVVAFNTLLDRYNSEEDVDLIRVIQEHPNVKMIDGASVGATSVLMLCPDHARSVSIIKNVDSEQTADLTALSLKVLDFFHTRSR
ncbi:serine hydrolase domain-containing protein [Microbulbifer sp. JMSA004]|uniref:serine hydrolase domain-containing protein n=1 Tax=Microbulbifer sp. JMSA004 TaxID=3243370 RepID=UPI004039A5BE